MATVYVTKYTLSDGIIRECTVDEVASYGVSGTQLFVNCPGVPDPIWITISDYEWTREKAMEQAESKRRRKIESLKKQIAKLEKQEFS
jgi:hypothetical protein